MTSSLVNYTIRPLTLSDEPFLWEMLYQAIYVPAGEPRPKRAIVEQPDLARYVRNWGREGDRGFLAYATQTQTSLGATWLRLWTGNDKGYGYVDDATPELSIAVMPAYREQGVGTQLLTQLLSQAVEHYSAVSLSVAASNPAVRLYQRFGFEIMRRYDDSVVMTKALKAY